MILEAEKSLSLPSANWRLRKVSGIIWRPESQRADIIGFSLRNLSAFSESLRTRGVNSISVSLLK